MNEKKSHPVHSVNDGVFNTANGRVVSLLNPTTEMINIYDIAAALSKICRFGGHTTFFYSVAQHSIMVCRMAPMQLKRAALIHDFAEAYIGDVIKPLKVLLGDTYSQIERRFEEVICEMFGVPIEDLALVKEYDMQACEVEFDGLQCNNHRRIIETYESLGMEPYFLDENMARVALLNEFKLWFGDQYL